MRPYVVRGFGVVSRPCIGNLNVPRSSPSFATTAVHHAPRSPTVRRNQREARREKRARPAVSSYPWPTASIERASREGFLPCDTLYVTVFLDDIAAMKHNDELQPVKVIDLLKRECSIQAAACVLRANRNADHDCLQPVHMTGLAQILRQSDVVLLHPIADSLLKCALELQEPAAAMALMEQVAQSGHKGTISKHELQLARLQLGKMAKEGKQAAMILYARVLEVEGTDPRKILRLLEDAVAQTNYEDRGVGGASGEQKSMPETSQSFWGGLGHVMCQPRRESDHTEAAWNVEDSAKASKASLAQAWRSIARIQSDMGRSYEARLAADLAARNYDDPEAYYMLAQHYEAGSNEYIEYLLKAAESGIPDAAYKVGIWSLHELEREKKQTKGRPFASFFGLDRSRFAPRGSTDSWFPLIRQWFVMAAKSPTESNYHREAKMHIARIMFHEGDMGGGRQLLQDLSQDRSIPAAKVKWLRELWKNGEPDHLTSSEFEDQIRSSELNSLNTRCKRVGQPWKVV